MGFYPDAREKSTFWDEMHQGVVHGPHKATSIFLAQKGRGMWDMTWLRYDTAMICYLWELGRCSNASVDDDVLVLHLQ